MLTWCFTSLGRLELSLTLVDVAFAMVSSELVASLRAYALRAGTEYERERAKAHLKR